MIPLSASILKLVSSTVKSRDLTLRQLALLELATAGGTEVRLACDNLSMSKPACTRAADRLAAEGLMDREPIEGDRRRALLVATSKGKKLIEQVRKLIK